MQFVKIPILAIAMMFSVTLIFPALSLAGDGKDILNKQCAQCHNLSAPESQNIAGLVKRKGPPLHYAGLKYKQEWLVSWLKNPTVIRPAGMYYGGHVKQGSDSDKIDQATLVKHPKLSATDAKQVVAELMTLKANGELIKPGEYKAGSIPMSMGEMLFDKFRGCLACHQIEPGYGGLSGPEVYTAAKRLQEDFMISYMRNPQAWDPRIFMPNKHLSDTDLQKFVHYFRALSKEGSQ